MNWTFDVGNAAMGAASFASNLFGRARAWKREDNAIERRVADLKRLGLNPVLAAGQGAQSSAPMVPGPPQVQEQGSAIALRKAQEKAVNKGIEKTDSEIGLNEALSRKADRETKFIDVREQEAGAGIAESSSRRFLNLGQHSNLQSQRLLNEANTILSTAKSEEAAQHINRLLVSMGIDLDNHRALIESQGQSKFASIMVSAEGLGTWLDDMDRNIQERAAKAMQDFIESKENWDAMTPVDLMEGIEQELKEEGVPYDKIKELDRIMEENR